MGHLRSFLELFNTGDLELAGYGFGYERASVLAQLIGHGLLGFDEGFDLRGQIIEPIGNCGLLLQ